MKGVLERLDAILAELQKMNNRMENMALMIDSWQNQDEDYHKRSEKILKGRR